MAKRIYNSTSDAITLNNIGGINTTATSITVSDSSTLPVLASGQTFTLVIDPDISGTEEIVTVTAKTGTHTYTISRGSDGSSPKTHAQAAVIKHMVTARDLQESQEHINATGAYQIKNDNSDVAVVTTYITKSLHGIGSTEGDVVGTLKSQTLTNKTLTSPIINNATITGTLTGGTINTSTINNSTVAGGTISGTVTNSGTISGGNVSATFTGNLTGNVTGNASTATTATNVAASGITGTTLASNVVNSSITKIGSLSGGLSGVVKTDSSGNLSASPGNIDDVNISNTANIAQSKILNLTTDLAAKAPLINPALTGTPTLNGTAVKRTVAGTSNVTFSSGVGTLSWGTTLAFTPVSFSAILSTSTATLFLCANSATTPSTTSMGLKCFDDAGAGFTGTIKVYWVAFE